MCCFNKVNLSVILLVHKRIIHEWWVRHKGIRQRSLRFLGGIKEKGHVGADN
jgi:hypothetical protein